MLSANFVSSDFMFLSTAKNAKQNETKNQSLWDPAGIEPFIDNYHYVLTAGLSASI